MNDQTVIDEYIAEAVRIRQGAKAVLDRLRRDCATPLEFVSELELSPIIKFWDVRQVYVLEDLLRIAGNPMSLRKPGHILDETDFQRVMRVLPQAERDWCMAIKNHGLHCKAVKDYLERTGRNMNVMRVTLQNVGLKLGIKISPTMIEKLGQLQRRSKEC